MTRPKPAPRHPQVPQMYRCPRCGHLKPSAGALPGRIFCSLCLFSTGDRVEMAPQPQPKV